MYQRIVLIGRLGSDPETRSFEGGSSVTSFSVAVSKRFKKRDGTTQETTEWFNIKAWGPRGVSCQEHLGKGSLVCVEGEIKTDKWEDKDGNSRTSISVVAKEIKFLSSTSNEKKEEKNEQQNPQPGENNQDDIPF